MKNGLREMLSPEDEELLDAEAEVLELEIELNKAKGNLLTKKLIIINKLRDKNNERLF